MLSLVMIFTFAAMIPTKTIRNIFMTARSEVVIIVEVSISSSRNDKIIQYKVSKC